jgi:hypothetical protein
MTELELAKALERLNDTVVVPPADPAREAALMAAFDAAGPRVAPSHARGLWYLTALAAALPVVPAGRSAAPPPSSSRGVQPDVTEFVIVPGAEGLPRMENGTIVRMDLPVSVLPKLGVIPPAAGRATVRADLVIGQDGLTRAVRLVN